MKMRNLALAAGAVTLIAAPAALSHPSTMEYVARVCPSSGACNAGTLTNQTQYVVMEHGYVMLLKENNSALNRGILNLKNLPSGYRSGLANKAAWFTADAGMSTPFANGRTGAADTGAQPHATCRGVAGLESGNTTGDANVLGWQGTDPFFNYVPWQAAASGLDDKLEVASWLATASRVSGITLTTSSTVAQFTAACTGIGGTYTAADGTVTTIASASSGVVADAVAPLNTQIADLQSQVSVLEPKVVQGVADMAASLGRLSPFTVAFASAQVARTSIAADGIRVTVTGPTGRTARVVVRTREGVAKRLHLPVVLGVVAGTPGANGTVSLVLKPSKGALRRIRDSKGAVPLIAEVLPAEKPGTATGELGG